MKTILIHICLGEGYVWNSEDVLHIRKNLRIVGCLEGCLSSLPRQLNLLGRPLRLLKEEIYVLLQEKAAEVVSYPELRRLPSESAVIDFHAIQKKAEEEQRVLVGKEREKQIRKAGDKILEGKLKKLKKETGKSGCQAPEVELNREEVIEEEIRKIKDLTPDAAMIQLFTEHPSVGGLRPEPADWSFPVSEHERTKAEVFHDLWKKGFYLTGGEKFGGDFLVYPGDPVRFHAKYIAICMSAEDVLTPFEISAYARVASGVKKKILLCTLIDDKISYKLLEWLDGKRQKKEAVVPSVGSGAEFLPRGDEEEL